MRDLGDDALYPVSVEWDPPFHLMTSLVGHGDPQSGIDVGATVTQWGTWQPAIDPTRGPTVTEALVGSLGSRMVGHKVGLGSSNLSLDVGRSHVCC